MCFLIVVNLIIFYFILLNNLFFNNNLLKFQFLKIILIFPMYLDKNISNLP